MNEYVIKYCLKHPSYSRENQPFILPTKLSVLQTSISSELSMGFQENTHCSSFSDCSDETNLRNSTKFPYFLFINFLTLTYEVSSQYQVPHLSSHFCTIHAVKGSPCRSKVNSVTSLTHPYAGHLPLCRPPPQQLQPPQKCLLSIRQGKSCAFFSLLQQNKV